MSLKGSNSHAAVGLERQQRGGDALHFTMQFSPIVYRFDGRQEVFLSRQAGQPYYRRALATLRSSAEADFL